MAEESGQLFEAVTGTIFNLIKRNFAPPEERLRSVIEREKQIPRATASARVLLNPQRFTPTSPSINWPQH